MPLTIPKRLRGVKTVSHNHAPKQEKRIAKDLSANVVKGSGCGDEKGDVRARGVVRIECKSTTNKSFSITRKILEKIEDAALLSGEVPIIEVEFLEPDGRVAHSVVVMPKYVLEMVVGELGEQDA